MAKKETAPAPAETQTGTDIAVPAPVVGGLADLSLGMTAPDFMHGEDIDFGLSEVGKYIIPPRMKVVQPQSSGAFKEQFNVGDVVLTPDMQRVFEMPYEGPRIDIDAIKELPAFSFAPLFFYVEWAKWNDIAFKGTKPAIAERTQDPNNTIARKAKNPNTRKEAYPVSEAGGKVDPNTGQVTVYYRYVEHLNYVVLLLDVPGYEDTPVMLSFGRSEHRSGTNFNALLKRRRCPIYGGQYEARMGYRKNAQGEWWGFDIGNPTQVPPYCESQQVFDDRRARFEDLKSAWEEQRIVADYDDDDAVVGTGVGGGEGAPSEF